MSQQPPRIEVERLSVGHGSETVQRDVTFRVQRGDVFVLMGPSGCGKSTLMRSMVGLLEPDAGRILYDGTDFWAAPRRTREGVLRRVGVAFQQGALWSSMTLAQNVALPLEQLTDLAPEVVGELVEVKLALVGLSGYGAHYPSELSGGMRKRAALARAMALDPDVLFFDEPSAGLDPVSARRLDQLILELRDSLGTTVIVVTHELASIFAIADNAAFLDAEAKTLTAVGPPRVLAREAESEAVRDFLTRGGDRPLQEQR